MNELQQIGLMLILTPVMACIFGLWIVLVAPSSQTAKPTRRAKREAL